MTKFNLLIFSVICGLSFNNDALYANVAYNENVMHATSQHAPSFIDRIREISPAVADAYVANHENEGSSLNILDCLSEIRFHYGYGNVMLVRQFTDLMYERISNIEAFVRRINSGEIATESEAVKREVIAEIVRSVDYCRRELRRYSH